MGDTIVHRFWGVKESENKNFLDIRRSRCYSSEVLLYEPGEPVTYRIASTTETNEKLYPLWWSNDQGWVEFEDSDEFTDSDPQTLRLPITGVWVADSDYSYLSSPKGYT
jgi:hypothetical protein